MAMEGQGGQGCEGVEVVDKRCQTGVYQFLPFDAIIASSLAVDLLLQLLYL
jgi:hypothetical protein